MKPRDEQPFPKPVNAPRGTTSLQLVALLEQAHRVNGEAVYVVKANHRPYLRELVRWLYGAENVVLCRRVLRVHGRRLMLITPTGGLEQLRGRTAVYDIDHAASVGPCRRDYISLLNRLSGADV